MERRRVLLVGPLPPPLGGVQMVVDMQLHSSLAREFEMHMVDISKRQLRWAVESPTWRTPLYFVRDVARLLRSLIRVRPDVVLLHAAAGLSFLRDWALMATARLAGARVVCHYHGTLHARFPSMGTRVGRGIGRLLMSVAHRVIVLGPTYRREMGKAWNRDDLVWAANPAETALFRGTGKRPVWLESGKRAVLFVGRLSAPKGIYDLFDAIPAVVRRHPEACFVLVGVAESDAMEPVVRAEAARRGIAAHLRFLGSLEGPEKAAAYAGSQMIVVPSWTEGFPLVIPEAMAAGLPVVATAVGAIPDFVIDGEDGFLIAPRNSSLLADRVCRLLGDEALRGRMSARVRARAPVEFDIEIGCRKVAQVLDEVLGSSQAGASDPEFRFRR